MAIELITTLAGEDANSWVDLDYADEYFESHTSLVKRDGWAALDDDQKTLALVTAAELLNGLKMTNGTTVVPSTTYRNTNGENIAEQSLQIPRNTDKKFDGTYFIPENAKMAQCEQAYYSSQFDESTLAQQRQGIFRDALDVDGVRIAQGFTGAGDAYSPTAIHLIRRFLIGVRSKRIRRS